MNEPCDHCGRGVAIGNGNPLKMLLPGARDKNIGSYCDECAERIASGDLAVVVFEPETAD